MTAGDLENRNRMHGFPADHENPKADPHWEWAKEPEVRESVRPHVAEMARVATFLASAGLSLSLEAYALFVDAVGDNLYAAISLLERRAGGDYAPDTTPETFPAFIDSAARRASGLDCWQLFEAFVKAAGPAESTVQRWRAVFLNLRDAFSDTGAAAITDAAARAWVAKLVSQKRSPKTVREVWVPAARRVFGWAEQQKHVSKNPFAGIKVDVPRKARNRETKAFMPQEVRTILRATLDHKEPRNPYQRAQR